MEKKKFKLGWKIHGLLLILMVAIIILVISRLDEWNKRTVVIDTNIDPDAYATESYDLSFHVNEEILNQHEDDGVNKMLVVGNLGFTASAVADENVYKELQKKMPDWQIDSVCATNSLVTCPTVIDEEGNPGGNYWSPFSLYYIVKSLCSKDYTNQEYNIYENGAIELQHADEWLENFKSVNIEEYDTVMIMYASSDYYQTQTLYNPEDDFDITTFVGSLRATIELLQKEYPYIRIVVSSPYLTYSEWNGEKCLGTLTNFGSGTEAEYVTREYDVCTQYCVSFIDNYFNYITEKNYEEYLENNGLNQKGIEAVANHIAEFMAD